MTAWVVLLNFFAPAVAQTRPTQTYEYDPVGNLTKSTDALGRSTQQTYDLLSRPRLTTQPSPAVGNPNPLIKTDYNPAGSLTTVTDPRSLATRYTTTGLGDLTQQVSPDTGTTVLTYDEAGHLKTRRDARGKTTTYSYDTLGRLIKAQYADGTLTTYVYDEGSAIGQLTRILDPGPVTSTYTYDLHGRILTRSQTVGAGSGIPTHTLRHSTTPGTGKRNQTVYPSGRILTLDYHPTTKEVQTVSFDGTVVAGNLQWHALQPIPKSLKLANGQTWTSTLDVDGRLTSTTLGNATLSLTWDKANRLTQLTHSLDPTQNQTYSYDNLDRLTGYNSTARAQNFTYDLTGNLTRKYDRVGSALGQTDLFTIAPTSNRLTQIASRGIGFGYDAAGNRTTTPNIVHTYNAKGRLISSAVTTGTLIQRSYYLYNALEQRVRKIDASGITYYVYDDAGQLIGEYDNLGRAKREYVWLPGQDGNPNTATHRPIALVTYTYVGTSTTPTSHALYAIETDHLGAARRVSNATNQTRWTWTPAPYGDTLPNENPSALGTFTLNLRFPGQYFDKETNLTYNHHRDYEATTGRYIQSDPIGLAGGINTYAYALGQPTKLMDPLGLSTYVCKRPLGGPPGPWSPPVVNHQYLCVDTPSGKVCGSTTASSGGALDNTFPFGPGSPGVPTSPTTDYYDPKACEKRWDDDVCIESCIARELTRTERSWYQVGPFGDDCQEFVSEVLRICEQRCVRR